MFPNLWVRIGIGGTSPGVFPTFSLEIKDGVAFSALSLIDSIDVFGQLLAARAFFTAGLIRYRATLRFYRAACPGRQPICQLDGHNLASASEIQVRQRMEPSTRLALNVTQGHIPC
jgi:hypothetical protein